MKALKKIISSVPFVKRVIRFTLSKMKELKPVPCIVKYRSKGSKKGTHVCAFRHGNAGDALLPVVLRDLFNEKIGVSRWKIRNVVKNVTKKDVKCYNKQDFIVVGGGGLFLKDTNPNDVSGWQWPCSIDRLNGINVPLIIFAVGYNRFRDQDDFSDVFTENLNALVEKASFVGLRNHGSIDNVKRYLKNDYLKQKIVFQPCMTTMISKIYPDLVDYEHKENKIALNCAFDRQKLRGITEEKLVDIASVVKLLSEKARIVVYGHVNSDMAILPYLDRQNVVYEKKLFESPLDMIKEYSSVKLVIGMRGHAQMIPFGCQTPILSIVTHDKMQWFLNDIGRPEWGCDILHPNFKENLLKKAFDIFDNYSLYHEQVIVSQDYLWNITTENLAKITKLLET